MEIHVDYKVILGLAQFRPLHVIHKISNT